MRCLLFCFFVSPVWVATGQSSLPVSIDSVATLVSSQFSFTEGPAVDKAGNIYFTDQPNNKIWKYGTDGKLSVFKDNAGRSNGMYFDRSGNLITCADEKNELWSIDRQGKVTVLLKDFKGHTLNGPNDCWIDPKDGIYFTDPYFQRDYWERKNADPGMNGEKIYYLPKGGNHPIRLDEDLKKPNGITGSADGKWLYVSDMGVNRIYKYQVNPDGTLANRTIFANDLADGITLDNQGNLYLAGRGVTVYDSIGKKIQQIPIPAGWTANLCFGGLNKDILFITASKSVFILRMKTKGIE